ncbi:MAG: hypothetical protein HC849_01950 [Oscillatoriales cyanobacterium RU_3_3]|nr:hypothetical protein [Oscillatoriales cyanobacterium RU_3_3]
MVNRQLSQVNYPRSTVNCKVRRYYTIDFCLGLSVATHPTTVNYQLSTVNCQLSTVNCLRFANSPASCKAAFMLEASAIP